MRSNTVRSWEMKTIAIESSDHPDRCGLDAPLGGRLAAELWQDLTGHASIQENNRLRRLLRREPSFEMPKPPFSLDLAPTQ